MIRPRRTPLARGLLDDLRKDVETLIPKDVRQWPDAQRFVDAPMVEFILRLSAWERCGYELDWDRTRQAHTDVILAWIAAKRAYAKHVVL